MTLSGFEIMAANDCIYLPSNSYTIFYGHISGPLHIIGYFSFSFSFIIGALILANKQNRNRYPLNYIGYICLT